MSFIIVLDEPENSDNIGAVARAMKNMELKDLRLVSPPADWKTRGKILAVGAAPLLQRAKIFESLKEAISDTQFVIGTTRRHGYRRRAYLDFDDALTRLKTAGKKGKAAIVFGKESKGLSNASLSLCDWFTSIPSSPSFGSLNLAQAVMVFCFELYRSKKGEGAADGLKQDFVSKRRFEDVMARFREAVEYLEYKPPIVERIDSTFRSMLQRGGLLASEGEMIKGLSRRIKERTTPKYNKVPRE